MTSLPLHLVTALAETIRTGGAYDPPPAVAPVRKVFDAISARPAQIAFHYLGCHNSYFASAVAYDVYCCFFLSPPLSPALLCASLTCSLVKGRLDAGACAGFLLDQRYSIMYFAAVPESISQTIGGTLVFLNEMASKALIYHSRIHALLVRS